METGQATSFENLLTQTQDVACARLSEAVRGMLDKADESLAASINQTRNAEQQKLYQDARKVVVAGRTTLEREFNKFYLKEFRFRASSAKEMDESMAEMQQSSLQLVGEEDLNETLKFKELATKLRKYCDEELAALDQRVGVLLGDANLQSDDNPFSPQAICDAYQQACHELDTTAQVRGVFMKLFDDHVLDEVRSIYKAVNATLVQNGILPKIKYGVSKKPGDRKEGPDEPEEKAEEKDAEQNLFALLQKMVGGGGGGGGAVGGGPAMAPAELMGSLDRFQQGDMSAIAGGLQIPEGALAGMTNMLKQLKETNFGQGMAQMDAMTLDIVSMIFDELFDDPKVPIGIKGLIGRLQIPMLKVAIADKSFFAKKTHPARKMLDTMGEIALRLPHDFDDKHPLFPRLEGMVQQVVDGFQEDTAIFEKVDEQLKTVIADEEKRVQEETRAVAERAAQAESLAVAKTAAEDEVRARVQGSKLPGPVLEFIIEYWLKLMLLIHARLGTGSGQWKEALVVMDQLVWSVQPKSTPDEKRQLAAAVPMLIKRLGSGLKAIGVGDMIRDAFFAELMRIHTEIMGTAKKAADAQAAAPAAAPAANLDFTAPVTVKNPYGGGEVQVASVAAIDPPEGLVMGSWVEFRPKDGAPTPKKLLFLPPKKTRYIFSDRNGKDILELTRAEIVRRLRSGEAVRLKGEPEQPLFDRIMNGLVGKLKTPAARAA